MLDPGLWSAILVRADVGIDRQGAGLAPNDREAPEREWGVGMNVGQ